MPKSSAVPSLVRPGAEPDGAEDGLEPAVNNRDYVNSLARGLEILRAFSRRRKRMTLSEVAGETGMTRAAARRLLLTLVREGYAETDGKLFDLTPQVLELGFSVMSSMGIWDVARRFMQRLSEEIEESVSASVLDGHHVVYVAGTQYHRVISVGVTLGSRLPAHCTATGRVLLALQPESGWDALIAGLELTAVTPRTTTDPRAFRALLAKVRDQGWALVDQELEIGLLSIAIPLRHRSGEVAGAINVGIPTLRATPADMVATILPRLHDTAAQISAALPG
jgi:IclR family pca regulon transcriptional regulator